MIRLHNLDRWAKLPAGDVLHLAEGDLRKVRVQVNLEDRTSFHLRWQNEGADDLVFLGVAGPGVDVIECYTTGGDIVATSEGEVWYFTNEGQDTTFSRPEARSFTRTANRRARNPQVELMMFKMEQNINRRIALVEQDNERLRREVAAREGADLETGEVHDDVGDGASSDDTGTAKTATRRKPAKATEGPELGADAGDDVHESGGADGALGA